MNWKSFGRALRWLGPISVLLAGLKCRPIGVIEGEQSDKKKKTIRNDRILAIQEDAHAWADIKTIDDLGEQFCCELEEFFVNYH